MIDRLRDAFNDDLDTPKVLAVLWETLRTLPHNSPSYREGEKEGVELSALVAYADQVFGLDLMKYLGKPFRIPREVARLVAAREEARQRKDWARSDVLRAQVEALGFQVEDTKGGPVVREVRSKK